MSMFLCRLRQCHWCIVDETLIQSKCKIGPRACKGHSHVMSTLFGRVFWYISKFCSQTAPISYVNCRQKGEGIQKFCRLYMWMAPKAQKVLIRRRGGGCGGSFTSKRRLDYQDLSPQVRLNCQGQSAEMLSYLVASCPLYSFLFYRDWLKGGLQVWWILSSCSHLPQKWTTLPHPRNYLQSVD